MPVEDKYNGYAPLSVVERHHSDNKAYQASHAGDHAKIDGRLARVEWAMDETIEKRLLEHEVSLTRIEDTLKPSLWKIFGVAAAILMTLGGIVWKLSRYPDREEFRAAQQEAVDRQRAVDSSIRAIENDQRDQKADVREIRAAVGRMESKIEEISRPPRRRTP